MHRHRHAIAILMLLMVWAPPAAAQPGGGGRPSERVPDENPTVLSPPIVVEPVYACATMVAVRGFVPHARLVVYVNGTASATDAGFDSNGHELTLAAPLVAGDVVTATQEVNGTVSDPSAPVVARDHTQDYPDGLPASMIDPPPLYQCGVATASHYHVPGAFIEFFSQPTPGSGSYTTVGSRWTTTDWSASWISPDFSTGEAITTSYNVCNDRSPMSAEEVVLPEPATIPTPTIGDLYEGGESVGIGDLLNGARLEVTVGSTVRGGGATCCSSAAVQVSPPLVAGEVVTATQELCNRSNPSGGETVQPCSALPYPEIRDPEVGDTFVEVTVSVSGARILIYDASFQEIGDGGGSLVALTRPVVTGDHLFVVQRLGNCTGAQSWEVDVVCKAPRFVGDPSGSGAFGVGVADYELPAITIGVDTVRMIGHVRYPTDPLGDKERIAPFGGRFPIAVLLHGNHQLYRPPTGEDRCVNGGGWPEVQNHRGYDYILDALARNGIIAVSISANDLNCKDDRIAERGTLILEHLALWKIFDDPSASDPAFGGMFNERVDLDRIGLFGHSRGGEAVVDAVQKNSDASLNVRAVLSLAPTDFHFMTQDRAPLLVVLPAGDGDVSDNWGARIYDRADQGTLTDWFKSQLYVYDADHNQFNREWRFPRFSGTSMMARADQETMIRAWTRTYFDHWLKGASSYRPIFAGDAIVPGLLNDKVYPSYEEIGALEIDDHQDGNALVNLMGGSLAHTFDVFDQFPFRQPSPTTGPYNGSFFHDTDGLVATWSSAGRQYSSDLASGRGDVSGFRYLSFRVAQINDPLNPGGPLSMDVGISDAANSNQVATSDIGEIPFPYDHGTTADKSMMRTLRVPLTCLQHGQEPVDLTDVRQVFFDSGGAGSGAVGHDQLSFSN